MRTYFCTDTSDSTEIVKADYFRFTEGWVEFLAEQPDGRTTVVLALKQSNLQAIELERPAIVPADVTSVSLEELRHYPRATTL